MTRANLSILALALIVIAAMPAEARQKSQLHSPEPGVLCDRYVCANDKGISQALTLKYLGKKAAAKHDFNAKYVDPTQFIFANGVFCDVKVRLCRLDRYYGPDGKPSGAISSKLTRLLFGSAKP